MDPKDLRIEELEARVAELEATVTVRSREIHCAQQFAVASSDDNTQHQQQQQQLPPLPIVDKLSPEHIERYSRQMMISGQGLGGIVGQAKLLSSSVLIVGAGGIGSTAILYLAAAGVGRLGIVDLDTVEVSNLHRQVIHTVDRVGWNKAVSACVSVHNLNPTIACHAYTQELTGDNALALCTSYNIVVDCSDNPKTRYLLNDACILAKKPLVSGSAVGSEGQLTVYNPSNNRSCYRCLYPRPVALSGQCRSCSDAGVLGPVPGLIGILQSIEVLKLLTSTSDNQGGVMDQKLLMYDAMTASFLTVKRPPKREGCAVCSTGSNKTIQTMEDSSNSLTLAAGPKRAVVRDTLPENHQVTCLDYQKLLLEQQTNMKTNNNRKTNNNSHLLLDVRDPAQFALCALPHACNIPWQELPKRLDEVWLALQEKRTESEYDDADTNTAKNKIAIYCICRRGVDSIHATKFLLNHSVAVYNIEGGLDAWRQMVDPSFPMY